MIHFFQSGRFVEGLLGKDIFELLVSLGTISSKHVVWVPSAASVSSGRSFEWPDLFQMLSNESYKELVTSVQIIWI